MVSEPRDEPVAVAIELGLDQIHRRRADELGDEEVRGPLVQPLRRVDLLEHPTAHHSDALEVELSRRLGKDGENARTAASESAPEKYRDAVAEYYKRLSR